MNLSSYGNFSYIGFMDYSSAMELQRGAVCRRQADETEDSIIFLQHPPVYTLGKRRNKSNLLVSEKDLSKRGIKLFQTDRGGDITFHGPGQLMIYPIIKLKDNYCGVGKYVSLLEKTVVSTLNNFSISGRIDSKNRGVWVEDSKIASIGIRVQKRVTMHGICLNVKPERHYFEWIVPCGIENCRITSIFECLGHSPAMEKIIKEFVFHFSDLFQIKLKEIKIEESHEFSK